MHRFSRLILISLLLGGCANPAPSASPPVLPSTVESPTAAPASASPEPTDTPSPAPPAWEPVATFGAQGGWLEVSALAHGDAGFLALGKSSVPANDVGWITTGDHLWASVNGDSWDEVPVPAMLAGQDLKTIVVSPAGSFVLFATRRATDGTAHPAVFTSLDGRGDWTAVDSGLANNTTIGKVVRGALGYLLLQPQTAGGDPALWFSTNGLSWERTQHFAQTEEWVQISDIGAGDEGFVALGTRTSQADDDWARFTIASGDGRTWLEEPLPFGTEEAGYRPDAFLTPVGPDWLAVLPAQDDAARFWASANGLQWDTAGRIDDLDTSLSFAPALFSSGGQLYFAPNSRTTPALYLPEAAWTSSDGRSWDALPLEGGPAVTSGLASTDGVLLGGMTVVNETTGMATIWSLR